MSVSQQFCLRWNNHQRTLISVFDSLLESGTLVDCTLAAEGRYLKAHKVVLSACSPYLGVLLSQHQEKHPILILKDIKFQELKSMLDYMYRGEVNISQEELGTFLKAAESLQIKGLTESAGIGVRDTSDFDDPVSKRCFDQRKQPPSLSSVSSNSPTIWSQNETVRTYSRPREGSLSPTSKKRKIQRTNGPDDHHQDNGDDSMTESEPQGIEKSPTNNNNIPSSVNKVIKSEPYRKSCSPEKEVLKTTEHQMTKPKQESISGDRQECLTEMSYDDSVEDMPLEEEEEEYDENELSQPGTSQDVNNTTVPQTNSWQLENTNQDSSSTVNTSMDCKDSDAVQQVEKFVCKLCGKVYQWKQSLKRHIREDRCDKGPQHACPRCGMSFKHTSRLNKHVILCPHIVFDDSAAAPTSSSSAAVPASTSSSSSSTVQRILKLPPPCPDALPITAAASANTTNTTATSSSPSQTILVLHLKNQRLAQNWNSKIQKQLGN